MVKEEVWDIGREFRRNARDANARECRVWLHGAWRRKKKSLYL
jgi:hypothetical protein